MARYDRAYDDFYFGRSDRGGVTRGFARYHTFGGRYSGNRGTPEVRDYGSGYPAGGGGQREARRNYGRVPTRDMGEWRGGDWVWKGDYSDPRNRPRTNYGRDYDRRGGYDARRGYYRPRYGR
jgi:hypothetical protein